MACVMGLSYLMDDSYKYQARGLLPASGSTLLISGALVLLGTYFWRCPGRRVAASLLMLSHLFNAFRGYVNGSIVLFNVFFFMAAVSLLIAAMERAHQVRDSDHARTD